MKTFGKFLLAGLFLLLLIEQAHAETQPSKWLQLDADSKERIKHLIKSDVENRRGFSTLEEDRLNTSIVEEERRKENSAYKAAIDAATSEFQRTKKRADDLTAQFQTASYDFEETRKNVDNLMSGIVNIDNSIVRYQEDIRAQQEALTRWLKTTKQGEIIVAVIYTRGFMDTAHKLEGVADRASAPLMAQHMGTYIQSVTKVINNVLTSDYIRAVEEGTAKWNREEPLRLALVQNSHGTTYLRIKRYELYPFQAPETGSVKPDSAAPEIRAAIITSMKDLESFLSQSNYLAEKYDLSRTEGMIRETAAANQQAEANQREQLISFRERITYLEQKIASARGDRDSLTQILTDKQTQLGKMTTELEVLRLRKDSAELAFQNAHAALAEKKRVHESIIIKTSLVTVKRSETPAETSAEAVLEELKDVLNDARMQHYTSTTEVSDGKFVDESERQAITEAKIIAVRSLAFINEGDSIRVKMAFRVRTVLDTQEGTSTAGRPAATPLPAAPARRPAATKTASEPPAKTPKPIAAVEKKAMPPPQALPLPQAIPSPQVIDSEPTQSAEALEFLFKLEKVSRTGNDVTFFVGAINKAAHTQYLAFYDETSRYDRSTITAKGDALQKVNHVDLWQGTQKIPASDAFRGIPVEPNQYATVELLFKETALGSAPVSRLNLRAYVGTRTFFGAYRWRSDEVPFNNVRVPK